MTASYRDLLLMMTNYPQRTPSWAIASGAAVTVALDAKLSAALCDVHLPPISNWLADKLINANEIIAQENQKGREAAEALLSEFVAGVPAHCRGTETVIDSISLVNSTALASEARCHDLTIVPVAQGLEYRAAAEALVFESGRPVLLMPQHADASELSRSIVIGWDGSRAAARAVADALPFLIRADEVRVVTVSKDKALPDGSGAAAIAAYLECHDVAPILTEVAAEGRSAGVVLAEYATRQSASMLVMGGFGHARARDFLLGGATKAVMEGPALPTMLSH